MKKFINILYFVIITNKYSHTPQRFWLSPAYIRDDFWDLFAPTAKSNILLNQIEVYSNHMNAFSGNRMNTNVFEHISKKLFELVLFHLESIIIKSK